MKIICLDFDGVIHSYTSGWQGARNIPDPPVEGALEWIHEALKARRKAGRALTRAIQAYRKAGK